jgi:hypothetical protein
MDCRQPFPYRIMDVRASQATFFEMLSAWSASFLADMNRISRGMNHRACKEDDHVSISSRAFGRLLPNDPISAGNVQPRIPRMNRSEVTM